MSNGTLPRVDMHVHVGLIGNEWCHWGHFLPAFRKEIVYKVFLLFARVPEDKVTDRLLFETTVETIRACCLDKVVCLAVDHVYTLDGTSRPDLSYVWAANEYIIEKVRPALPDKVLLGASVHPYDRNFERRVRECVEEKAVLLKWVPSAQQINLATDRARECMIHLATAKNGKPLPLLLHCGVEYALLSTDPKTHSWDFLTWGWLENFTNSSFLGKHWYKPEVDKIRANIEAALNAGAEIIFAHCGLPYYAHGLLEWAEHSDFKEVRRYLENSSKGRYKGRCFADVSAFCTWFRQPYFKDVKKLPPETLLLGSDFPTPSLELSADLKENVEDLKAMFKGHFERIIVPEDNLLDVNYRELRHYFGEHPLFTNAAGLFGLAGS